MYILCPIMCSRTWCGRKTAFAKAMLFQWHMPYVIQSILSKYDLSMPEIYLILSYLIRRCQIEDMVVGYKRAIDEIRGPIAKNGFSGQNPARWPENGPPSGRTATYRKTKVIQSYLRIWGLKGIVHNFFIFGQDSYFG